MTDLRHNKVVVDFLLLDADVVRQVVPHLADQVQIHWLLLDQSLAVLLDGLADRIGEGCRVSVHEIEFFVEDFLSNGTNVLLQRE